MKAIMKVLVGGVAVAGLAAATNRASDHEWKAVLKPGAGSNITGEAEVEDKDKNKKTEAEISIKGATPGAEHPWHVHQGKCGSNGSIIGAATAYPVLKVKENGEAKAEAKLDIEAPTSGEYYVNVHKSAADMKTIVACGDLVLEPDHDKDKAKSGY
jgi:Cu/Zn superoxide dismutase